MIRKEARHNAVLASPYTMRRVRVAYVDVLGTIWMPAATCSMRYPLSDYDLENIGEFTRKNVEQWICTHAGDFQAIKDFHAVCGETEIAWASEENEMTYYDTVSDGE
jgi:hypothetical protein